VGDLGGAGAGSRALPRPPLPWPHRPVAGRRYRYRWRRPVHRAQHAHLQHRDGSRVRRDGGQTETAVAARSRQTEPRGVDVPPACGRRGRDRDLAASGPVHAAGLRATGFR
jgi:hypothetical protein